jgi:hypothetical protein
MCKVMFDLEHMVNVRNFYLKLEPEFLRSILVNVSKINSPYRDKHLAERLGLRINNRKVTSISIYQWFRGKRTIPSSKLAIILKLLDKGFSWQDVERNLITIKTGNGPGIRLRPNFPIVLNERLGLLVGHIMGDGSIDKMYSSVFFSNSNRNLLVEFYSVVKEVFNLEPRIWLQESGNFKTKTKWIRRLQSVDEIENGKNYGIFCNKTVGELLFCIFGKFACGHFKKIPDMTFSSPQDFKIGMIRAFFDDECTISKSGVRVFQDDEKMLNDIRHILIDLGISPCKVHSYVKRGKMRFYFDISGFDNLVRYRNIVGMSHSEKKVELDSLIKRLQSSKTQRLRIGQSKSITLEFLKSGPLSTSDITIKLKANYPRIAWKEGVARSHLLQLESCRKVTKYKVGKGYSWNLLIP